MSRSLPFTILGGYLGAGKTTVLNQLLAGAHGLRIAVVVNDFGSVNIDAELIRRHDGETISLANGCVCCSLVDGFATTIARIQERADDFDQIVIEASGVSDPARIANYGKAFQLELDGVIVVCDAERASVLVKDKFVGGTVKRQLANADLILLNKTDLVSSDELARVRTMLAGLAPQTSVIETVRGDVPFEVLLGVHRDREPAGVIPGESAPDHTGA
jgi:G3E family GTPase